ncbi:MAG: hypothetical protein Q9198_009281 [Flavoplaca austrocitrina]
MALPVFRAPVNYEQQLAAFEDFLASYKSVATELEIPSNALQGLNIDGDDDNTSDEYDFMDDVAGQKEKQQADGHPKPPRKKYIEQLQEVADRKRNEIMIELDDLNNVIPSEHAAKTKLMFLLVREKPR